MPLDVWQIDLRDVRLSSVEDDEATVWVESAGLEGWGAPVAALDAKAMGHGSDPGRDTLDTRLLTIPMVIDGSANETGEALALVAAAFAPTSVGVEEMTVRLPWWGDVTFFGRPRGIVDVNLTEASDGVIECVGVFAATDPMAYGQPAESLGNSGTFAVTVGGTAPTSRATLTIVGNGGTPTVTHAAGSIEFVDALTAAHVAVVDLRERTVTIEGAAAPEAVTAASEWFRLAVGSNSITLAGAASVDIEWRAASW